jgi:hypothetical protein
MGAEKRVHTLQKPPAQNKPRASASSTLAA